MMNWKDFLNYLISSIKITVSVIVLLYLINIETHAQQDSISADAPDTVFVMQKSPWGAVIRSAVIPGWGQVYNESYIKAVVFWGVGAWLGYNWILSNNDYNQYKNFYNLTNNPIYLRQRDISRDNRDLFSIYIVLTYVLNLVDAYVDAHLFDFTVEEDFFRQPLLNVRIKF